MNLAELQKAADDRYGDFVLDLGHDGVVILRTPLKFSEEEIAEFTALGEAVSDGLEDLGELSKYAAKTLELAAEPGHRERLAAVLSTDKRFAVVLLEKWQERVNLEKASA